MPLLLRSAAWTLSISALITAALIAWGFARPSWLSYSNWSIGVTRGHLEIGWSSGSMHRMPAAWNVRSPQGQAFIILGPQSAWRPTMTNASIGMSPGGAPLFKLTAIYIPLWPWTTLFALTGPLAWWKARRIPLPGHCRKCGYDLQGLANGPCPECGTLRTLLSRVIAVLAPLRAAPLRVLSGR
jgi:hypothetical protein